MAAVVHEYRGIRYTTHTEVYAPHDDTWLLVDAVHDLEGLEKGMRVLEVGCGAALGLIAALRRGARGVGLDRNPAALRLARENARRNDVGDRTDLVCGDLLGPVRLERFDWVLFNPPYLPTAPEERLPGDLNLAFDGGPSGNETILRFIGDLTSAMEAVTPADRPGLLMVTSSLNDRDAFKRALAAVGYTDVTGLGSKAFPFERLHAEAYRAV